MEPESGGRKLSQARTIEDVHGVAACQVLRDQAGAQAVHHQPRPATTVHAYVPDKAYFALLQVAISNLRVERKLPSCTALRPRAYADGTLARAVHDASAGHAESSHSHITILMAPGIHTACRMYKHSLLLQ